MEAWVLPAVALVLFTALTIWASLLIRKKTGRVRPRGPRAVATLVVGVAAVMTCVESFAPLGRPWMPVLAGVVAGVWSLVTQALFGDKTPSR